MILEAFGIIGATGFGYLLPEIALLLGGGDEEVPIQMNYMGALFTFCLAIYHIFGKC